MKHTFTFLILVFLTKPLCGASSGGKIALTVQLTEDNNGQPSKISGSLHIQLDSPTDTLCVFLPLNDPSFSTKHYIPTRLKDIEKSIEGNTNKGTTRIFEDPSYRVVPIGRSLVRIEFKHAQEQATLLFETSLVPAARDEWFIEHFYPYLKDDCASPSSPITRPNAQKLVLKTPITWQALSAHSVRTKPGHLEASIFGAGHLSFILTKINYTSKEYKEPIPTKLYTQGQEPEVFATLSRFLTSHIDLFGPYPFPSLTLIESVSLPTLSRPGLLILNRPRQKIFESLQNDVLNWKYWILSSMLAHQWYGNAIDAASPSDAWLIEGMIEFATLLSTSQSPRRSNLFNTWDHGYSFLDFTYLQYQNLTAQLLYRDHPFLRLTNTSLESISTHKLAYIKHALALRYLKTLMGDEHFFAFTRELTQHHILHSLNPKEFHDTLERFARQRLADREVSKALTRWWVSKDWLNASILDVKTTAIDEHHWLTALQFNNESDLSFPIGVFGKNGQQQKIQTGILPDRQSRSRVEFLSDFEPLYVKVDPQNKIFDVDRFNNSTQTPAMEVIPGPGRTFSDEKYTTVWMPFALRSPGEQTSVGLRAGTFRYVHSWLHMKLEGKPEEGTSAYHLEFQKKLPLLQSQLKIDHSLNYFGDQITSTGLQRELEWRDQSFQLLAKLSQRRIVGQENTAYQSVTVGFNIPNVDLIGNCSHSLLTSSESSLRLTEAAAPYQRILINPSLTCKPVPELQTNLRLFAGRLFAPDGVPAYTLFRVNDLNEAGLRIDSAHLAPERNVNAASLELLTPFPIVFIPDSIFLVRKMKFKLFYDIGYAEPWDPLTRMRAAGTSLILPLGGDVIGAGTLILSQFSVTSVFYTEYYGDVSRTPRILFDISGTL
ncbi:MAG: hypothetical protein HYW48_12295 [Deltaproteobacteria bacterium]|nr:hypothetical protein [Deltaproteobacteria bacterium]